MGFFKRLAKKRGQVPKGGEVTGGNSSCPGAAPGRTGATGVLPGPRRGVRAAASVVSNCGFGYFVSFTKSAEPQ